MTNRKAGKKTGKAKNGAKNGSKKSVPKSDNHKGLSSREIEILNGLAKGYLYKEIAEECGIAIDTVKKHCKNIYRKLDARNRTEAIKFSGPIISSKQFFK